MSESTKTYFSNSHAFIVGINDYQQVSKLSTAVNDARRLSEELKSKHGYQTHLLLDPNKGALQELISKTLKEKVQKDDRLIFYFAGHGIAVDADDDQDGQPQGYLVPADANPDDLSTFVPMELLNQQLNQLPSRHLLLILDCCFSGSFEWSSRRTRFLGTQIPKKIYQERFDRYIQDPAWQVITSSAHDQKALDVMAKRAIGERGEEEGQHSPFALSLFEALDGKADVVPADDLDGVITASELYIFLRDQVEQKSISEAEKLRQTPKFFNLARHDKGEFIFFHPTHPLNLDPIPRRNPYKGLQSFDEEDANLFYGRDKVIEALQKKSRDHNFLVITGASGTGKSSVIKAGLIPSLRDNGFRILPSLRPNKTPLSNLMAILAEAKLIPEEQEFSEGRAKELIQKINAEKTFLLVDQYEELITQCEDEREKDQFIDFLKQLLESDKSGNLCLTITVRADFEPQFEKGALAKYWAKARFTVPPFSLEELMEVIEKPAIQEVLLFDPPELVSEIANEVIQAPGALPLLSFLLSELYLKCYSKGRSLTREAYLELGGVIGSLRTRADELYQSLDDAHRQSMRQLMLRMLSLEGGEIASRRVFMDELDYPEAAQNARLKTVLDKLLSARLIVQGKDRRGEIYVEPAHDALVRAWATLWEWLKKFGEENLILQRRLHEAVQDTQKLRPEVLEGNKKVRIKEQSAVLWEEDARLEYLNNTLKSGESWLNATETRFVEASQRLKALIKKRRRRELILAFSVLGILLLGAISAAIIAFNQARIAEEKRQEVLKENYVNQMVSLSLEIPEEYPILKRRLIHQGELAIGEGNLNPALEFGRNAADLLIPDNSFFDNNQLLAFESKKVYEREYLNYEKDIVLSPSQNYMLRRVNYLTRKPASGLEIWDLRKGSRIGTIDAEMGEMMEEDILQDLMFTRDESGIIASSYLGKLKHYDLAGEVRHSFEAQGLEAAQLDISGDGKYLLSSSASRVILWDLSSHEMLNSIDLAEGGFRDGDIEGSFSEDGKSILLLGRGSFFRVLDSPSLETKIEEFGNFDKSALSPDAAYVLLNFKNEYEENLLAILDWEQRNSLGGYTLPEGMEIKKLGFLPDGVHCYVQFKQSNKILILNIEGQEIAFFEGAMSPDAQAIMIRQGASSELSPELFVWDKVSKEPYLGTFDPAYYLDN